MKLQLFQVLDGYSFIGSSIWPEVLVHHGSAKTWLKLRFFLVSYYEAILMFVLLFFLNSKIESHYVNVDWSGQYNADQAGLEQDLPLPPKYKN